MHQLCTSKFLLFNSHFRVCCPPFEKYISITMSDFMCFCKPKTNFNLITHLPTKRNFCSFLNLAIWLININQLYLYLDTTVLRYEHQPGSPMICNRR